MAESPRRSDHLHPSLRGLAPPRPRFRGWWSPLTYTREKKKGNRSLKDKILAENHRRASAERIEGAEKTEKTEQAERLYPSRFPPVPFFPSFPRSLLGPQERGHVATGGRGLDRGALYPLESAHASARRFRLRWLILREHNASLEIALDLQFASSRLTAVA